MKNWVIWCVVLLATVGTACTKGPEQAAETGKASELVVDLGDGVKMEFVLIPAGEFMMGDEKGDDKEKPVHKVKITKPFHLGKYEVTQEQWQAVMGNNSSYFKGPKNPVDSVTWGECQAFFAKLNEKFGAGRGKFSLPTEAQWEYACRAGTTTRYSFGDDAAILGHDAWWGENAEGTPHPVGHKKPNPWGLYDMHGNVLEWCADWFAGDYYGKSPAEDPGGPASGQLRVLRGGDADTRTPDYFRCAYRLIIPPERHVGFRGIRVAKTLTP